jgi:hypothetical protein
MEFKVSQYTPSSFIEFVGNPLVEALPGMPEPSEIPRKLLVKPMYTPEERLKSVSDRLSSLQRISALHIPTQTDTEIAVNISRCLTWGYIGRNPISQETVDKAIARAGYVLTEPEKRYLSSFIAPIYGFPIIGISGVGKSTSIVNILQQYPQVIRHAKYGDEPFVATQVVWLKVDCPCDGSPKGLSAAVIHELDRVVGTQYSAEFITSRVSKDVLLLKLNQLAATFHLGILVIDEAQNLCSAKKEVSRELLNYLVTLANTIRVPVVMVGSPMMSRIFQSSFQQAKRVTGQGEVHMKLMKRTDKIWPFYFQSMWTYQYTKQIVELTGEMRDAFFEESVGNPFICSILYKLTQEDAILSRKETFDVQDVRRVSHERLGLTVQMRQDMLNGKDVDLSRLQSMWNPPAAEVQNEPSPEETIPLQTVQQKVAEKIFVLLKTDYDRIFQCVGNVMKENGAMLSEEKLIRLATTKYLELAGQEERGTSK